MQHTITLPGTGPQTHNESSSNTWEVCGVLWTLSLPVTDSWLLCDYVTVCSTSSPSPSVLPRRGNTLITYLKIMSESTIISKLKKGIKKNRKIPASIQPAGLTML